MITLSEAYRKLDNKNTRSRHLNEADYVTLGNIKLPTDMTGMDDNTSYQDAAKIGQRLYDKEQVRLAKVKAEQEGASLYAECQNALKSSPDNVKDKLSALFGVLVPQSGKCDTVAGEIIRAAMRILYRWFNDGDIFFLGYGFETAGPSAQYLIDTVPTVKKDLIDISYHEDEYPSYERDLHSVIDKVIDYVMKNPRLFGTKNTIDSVSVPVTDFEEATFSYDVDVSGEDFDMLMDAGIIGWNDVRDFLDDTIRYNSVFDGAYIEQWAADAFTIDNLTKDGLDELEDNMDRWLADWCQELIEENQDMLYNDDGEDEFDENLNSYSHKRRITEAEDKKYALGTLVAKHMKEINSITNKNELIDFVSGLKNQVSDQTYLTREVIPNLQRKNFVAGLQYIMNIALKGEKKGSIEKEFSRKSTKRNSRRRVNEAKRLPLRYYFRSIKKSLDYEDVYDFADDLDNDYPDSRLTWLIDKLAVMFVQTHDGPNGPFSKYAICNMDNDLYEMLTKDLYINVDYFTSIISDLDDEFDDLDDEQAEEFDEEVDNTMQRLWRDIRTTIWYSQELLG